ncbi:hypothetical protein L1987_78011 [Smallanthus sonchifolius]|uniref:Uncharacterized protein n=1 Tax=Smallanthus sonchifolius TaxID=185202 RepID=A0ACB8ZBN8_9ASTR|nr:hypothetical protein L1987_78011 [Smallanthus sonchifolius]
MGVAGNTSSSERRLPLFPPNSIHLSPELTSIDPIGQSKVSGTNDVWICFLLQRQRWWITLAEMTKLIGEGDDGGRSVWDLWW